MARQKIRSTDGKTRKFAEYISQDKHMTKSSPKVRNVRDRGRRSQSQVERQFSEKDDLNLESEEKEIVFEEVLEASEDDEVCGSAGSSRGSYYWKPGNEIW